MKSDSRNYCGGFDPPSLLPFSVLLCFSNFLSGVIGEGAKKKSEGAKKKSERLKKIVRALEKRVRDLNERVFPEGPHTTHMRAIEKRVSARQRPRAPQKIVLNEKLFFLPPSLFFLPPSLFLKSPSLFFFTPCGSLEGAKTKTFVKRAVKKIVRAEKKDSPT